MNPLLILVKHSVPDVIESVPAREWHLSEEGRKRAERLAEQLISYQPEVLISSTEPKARETAEIVGRGLQLCNVLLENLHEHDRSKMGYLSKEDFETAVREFFSRPGELVFGGETADEAHARFASAVSWIIQKFEKQTILIVAHGAVISLFVSRLTGVPAHSLWTELGLPSFVVLDLHAKKLIAKENIL